MNYSQSIFAEHWGELLVIVAGSVLIIATTINWKRFSTKPRYIFAILLICGAAIFDSVLRIMSDLNARRP